MPDNGDDNNNGSIATVAAVTAPTPSNDDGYIENDNIAFSILFCSNYLRKLCVIQRFVCTALHSTLDSLFYYPYKCYMQSTIHTQSNYLEEDTVCMGFLHFDSLHVRSIYFIMAFCCIWTRCTTLACQLFIFCSGSVVVSIFFWQMIWRTHTYARARGPPLFFVANLCSLLAVFRHCHHSYWSNIVCNGKPITTE